MTLKEHNTTDSLPSKTDKNDKEQHLKSLEKVLGHPTDGEICIQENLKFNINNKSLPYLNKDACLSFPSHISKTTISLHTGAAKIAGLPFSQLPIVALLLWELKGQHFNPALRYLPVAEAKLQMNAAERKGLPSSTQHSFMWWRFYVGLDTS